MTTFVFHSKKFFSDRTPRVVNANWLPSTLQNVHLRTLVVSEGIEVRRLPRELRYFCTDTMLQMQDKIRDKLDLSQLPRKLEEFLIVGEKFAATLVFQDLPPNIRLLYFSSLYKLQAYVENDKLPKSLGEITIDSTACKIHSLNESAVDKRVSNGPTPAGGLSERYNLYSEQIRTARQELSEPMQPHPWLC